VFIALRLIHIITGVFWAGAFFFIVSFLMPAFKDAGPDAGKVAASLQNRRLTTWMPVMALLAILSGLALYGLRMQGGGWAATTEARTLGVGAVAAIVAFVIGLATVRPAMIKADALGREAAGLSGAERDAKLAAANALRARSAMWQRTVATLLLVTIVTMAIARYA
jgi:uncharacterized membrane protein